ncbi:glycosyltransferase family 2 protein, partial [Flavihumibacter sp. CACIAM 22H1]|uniref:glycosyltransferase family 2 protein n=1 Tax=Flavihumibacter sp. CACIAM 22H1 TaxID=1812911 RepID=UPI0007A8EA6F
MLLSVVIVNYNVCFFLQACLYSLRAALQHLDHEIIVVDNASTDNSRAYLPSRFPEVRFIWNETNLGFSKANNLGAATAAGEYLLILNPDTILPENCISTALDFIQSHPDAGAVGMRMYDGRFRFLPESKRGFPSLLTAFYKLSGLIHVFPRNKQVAHYYLGHRSPDIVQQVEVLAGACMLLPRQLYLEVGGFDERYFMYGEDIDLSYSITQAGYKNYYLPHPGIIHFKGESTVRSAANARHFYEAMLSFRHKYGKKATWFSRFLVEFAIGVRTLREKLKISPGTQKIPSQQQFHTCSQLTTYDPAIPTIFVPGLNYSLEEVFGTLKNRPPKTAIRFKWPQSDVAVGSD